VLSWCDSGFHLVNSAKALHVHRNTLIYRLAKIERLTGRNPREHRFAVALYVAALIDELDSWLACPHDQLVHVGRALDVLDGQIGALEGDRAQFLR
jgi:hypothetical protein